MKKVVLKLDVHDEKCKQKAMRMVSSLSGLDSISMDLKEKKLTLTGDIDAVAIVSKLRKAYHTEIISIGPKKEPEKKKDEPKKAEAQKKDEPKKGPKKEQAKKSEADDQPPTPVTRVVETFYNPPPYPVYFARSVEEDPNACVIC